MAGALSLVAGARALHSAPVAQLLRHFYSDPERCAYLEDRDATQEYRLIVDVSAEELETLLERGWRRFGPAYFRPACAGCAECVSLRVPVRRFTPSKSQRRVMRRVSDKVEVRVGRPQVDVARLELYHRWHEMRSEDRGWQDGRLSLDDYAQQFAYPHEAAREFAYYTREGELFAIALTDETEHALSAIYTFFSPDYAAWSPGTISVLFQLRYAAAKDKDWLYLGYRIEGCASSRYKAQFRPHQLLPPPMARVQGAPWEES